MENRFTAGVKLLKLKSNERQVGGKPAVSKKGPDRFTTRSIETREAINGKNQSKDAISNRNIQEINGTRVLSICHECRQEEDRMPVSEPPGQVGAVR